MQKKLLVLLCSHEHITRQKKAELGGGGGNAPLTLFLKTNKLKRSLAIGFSVFLLCLFAGIISGTYLKDHTGEAEAASANITVVDNNQITTTDQGTPTIVRSSTVTVKDTTATLGYTLSAQITQNTITGSTATIYPTTPPQSPTTSPCTESSPCTLNPSTPTEILETTNTSATNPQGHTTDWTVTITLPTNTPQGNYLLDIAYLQDPILPPPPLAGGDNMQDATSAMCSSTPMGTTVNLKDTRDNKYYRVRKMADNRCWMIDNIAYDIGTATGRPTYNPTAQLISGTTASVNNRAQYIQNNNIAGQGQIPNNGNPTSSYLYNWCAAMGDTSVDCATTRGYTTGQPTTTQLGICPAPFRLPTVGVTPSPSIQGNGSNQSTAAETTTNEFAKLDIWLGGTGTNRGSANTYPNFTTDNATNPQLFFSGVLSGFYLSGLNILSTSGYWWGSTASSGTNGYNLSVNSGTIGLNGGGDKNYGFAVRCILWGDFYC